MHDSLPMRSVARGHTDDHAIYLFGIGDKMPNRRSRIPSEVRNATSNRSVLVLLTLNRYCRPTIKDTTPSEWRMARHPSRLFFDAEQLA
jgi:hypothetical protein